MEKNRRQIEKFAELHGLKPKFFDYAHSDGRKGFSAQLSHANVKQGIVHAKDIADSINASKSFEAINELDWVHIVRRPERKTVEDIKER